MMVLVKALVALAFQPVLSRDKACGYITCINQTVHP